MIQVVVTQDNDVYNVFEFRTDEEMNWFINQLPESMRVSLLDPEDDKKILKHNNLHGLIRPDVIVSTFISLFVWTVFISVIAFVVFMLFPSAPTSSTSLPSFVTTTPNRAFPTIPSVAQNDIVITPLITPRAIGQQPISTPDSFSFSSVDVQNIPPWAFLAFSLLVVFAVAGFSLWLAKGSSNR